MKCILCNQESEKNICKTCIDNHDIKYLFDQIMSIKDIDNEVFNNLIIELTANLDTPMKEYYQIVSNFKKYYYISKDKREWLINTAPLCLNDDSITDLEKNKIKCSLIEAYYKNYNFETADLLANELVKEESLDSVILYQLGDFYITTRRYSLASSLLNKALLICQNEDFKTTINNKLNDCQARENRNKNEYLPATNENRIIYKEFLTKIGIDIELPKVRTKAPEKISPEDYPAPIELQEPNFNSFVAFDIETTGIDHTKDSITELAAIRVVDGKIVESKEFIFQELVHPYKRKIPCDVEKLTGITNEMVYNSREIWEVFKDFADFIKDDILLGYNCMTFDSKFLTRAGRLSNIKIDNKYFDVMNYVKKFKHKLNYDSKTLSNISSLLGIENPNAHRALADSITTAKVYLKLLEIDNKLYQTK